MVRFIRLLLLVIGCGIWVSALAYGDIIAQDCQSKDVKDIQSFSQQILPQFKHNCIDYTSEQAKEMLAKFRLATLPFVYFSKEVAESENFLTLVKQGTIDKKEGYFFIPQNRLPPTKLFLINRQNEPNRLDLFVMSQCPYGKEAERVLIEYIRANNLKIDLRLHYIVTFRKFGIDSLHGPEEIQENVWQLLMQKYYPDKFFDYLLKRNAGRSFYEVTKELEVDVQKLAAQSAEGIKLLEADFAITRELNIRSSPTIIYQNQYLIPRLDALSKEEPFTKLPPPATGAGKGSCQ